jgi:hypothetical protein
MFIIGHELGGHTNALRTDTGKRRFLMEEKNSNPAQGREVPNQIVGDCRSDAEESKRAQELDNLIEEMEKALEANSKGILTKPEANSKGILTQEEIDALLKRTK